MKNLFAYSHHVENNNIVYYDHESSCWCQGQLWELQSFQYCPDNTIAVGKSWTIRKHYRSKSTI